MVPRVTSYFTFNYKGKATVWYQLKGLVTKILQAKHECSIINISIDMSQDKFLWQTDRRMILISPLRKRAGANKMYILIHKWLVSYGGCRGQNIGNIFHVNINVFMVKVPKGHCHRWNKQNSRMLNIQIGSNMFSNFDMAYEILICFVSKVTAKVKAFYNTDS